MQEDEVKYWIAKLDPIAVRVANKVAARMACPSIAEDLAQVARMNIWKVLVRWDLDKSTNSNYLHKVCWSVCYEHAIKFRFASSPDKALRAIRSNSYEGQYTQTDWSEWDHVPGRDCREDPGAEAESVDEREAVLRCAGEAGLTDREREYFDCVLGGMSAGRILDAMGLSRQRVHQIRLSMISKFRRKLRLEAA